MDNFYCKKSGDTFFFAEYKTTFTGGIAVWKDKFGERIVHPKTKEILEPIPKEGFPTFFKSERERLEKTQSFFRERAKKHANSTENKIKKEEVIQKEMNNIGVPYKKKTKDGK